MSYTSSYNNPTYWLSSVVIALVAAFIGVEVNGFINVMVFTLLCWFSIGMPMAVFIIDTQHFQARKFKVLGFALTAIIVAIVSAGKVGDLVSTIAASTFAALFGGIFLSMILKEGS
jgi:hypothetical protein